MLPVKSGPHLRPKHNCEHKHKKRVWTASLQKQTPLGPGAKKDGCFHTLVDGRTSYIRISATPCVLLLLMDMVGISERRSANQRALHVYANHVPTEHNIDICISISLSRRLLLMLMSWSSSQAHKLFMLMIVLASH